MVRYGRIDVKTERKLNFKKIILLILIIIAIFLIQKYSLIKKFILLINPIKIETLSISTEKTQIELGESILLSNEIYPNDYTKSGLSWQSSNPETIEVVNGKITGKNVGKAIVYLVDNETGVKSNEIEFESLVSIKDVEIENQITTIQLGNVHKLETKVLPDNATYKDLEYESSDINILSIDNDGNMIANAIGKTNISIKDYKGNELKNFEIEVTKIPVEKITLDDTEVKLGKGQKYILKAEVTPLEATYTDVTWKSSNTKVVTIENRQITALSEGTVTISAITDNGDKTATCKIIVTNDKPNNLKKFANGNYNIRTGNSTDFKILATTKKYEEIELLQDDKNGWKKVRNSEGIVGYTLIKDNYYLKEKPIEEISSNDDIKEEDIVTSYHIDNVPYLNQISLGYPTGCEAVSATMLLKFKKYDVSVKTIIDNTKIGSKKYKGNDGKWYGANPFEKFVGHPSNGLSKGSYGVFAKPIVDSMKTVAGDKVKNISGCSENMLFSYVSKGQPVVVWCVKNGGNISDGVVWNYEDGSGSFQELIGEHCAVLIGYDENYVYLNDPSAGKDVKQSKVKFISNWKKLYSQAIIVE